MAWYFSKSLTEITHDDLKELIGVPESDHLEFKREAYGRSDGQVREMLKDISSFANAVGGYLLLGVETDKDEQASRIVGISDAETEAMRMQSSCLTNIEDHIIGLTFHLVPISENRKVLIWHIPRSSRAPHMITYKGLYQCWRRHGRQTDRMTIEEIRSACLRTHDIQRDLSQFMDERRARVIREVGSEPYLVLMATPLVVRGEVIDTADETIRSILQHPPYDRPSDWTVDCSLGGPDPTVVPTLFGAKVEIEDWCRLDLFRNGHAEFRQRLADNHFKAIADSNATTKYLNPWVMDFLLSFLCFVKAVMEQAALTESVVVRVILVNALGLRLYPRHPESRRGLLGGATPWEEDQHLELPAMVSPYPLNPGMTARAIGQRIWNAFGYDNCPMFDEEGRIREKPP